MANLVADRNLLVGIVALQMDFITREALVAAMNAWLLAKSRPLEDLLLEQQALDAEARELLVAIVAKHLKRHGGDVEKSLAALGSPEASVAVLRELGDAELNQSLAQLRGNDSTLSYQEERAADGRRFRILRLHARGGLGEVFVARDEELHRDVAVKEIQAHSAASSQSRARFLLEAEITARLEHPGIVPVYALGHHADGRPYYAMRFIQGDSFKDAMQRFHTSYPTLSVSQRQVDFRKLLARFVEVCQAIAYAHSRGVLHRDIKPSNVMLGKFGETLVVDWGLAKAIGREEEASGIDTEPTLRPSSGSGVAATQLGDAVGTPAYMSPEQALGRVDLLTPASDVYSLGATLYTLLTGKAPFDSGDGVLARVAAGEFSRPRGVAKHVPRALEAICLKAMAREPGNRYRSATALAEDLERYLAGGSVSVYDPPFRRAQRWVRRHPWLTSFGVATFSALLGIGVGEYSGQQEGANAVRRARKALREGDPQLARKEFASAANSGFVFPGYGTQREGADGLLQVEKQLAESARYETFMAQAAQALDQAQGFTDSFTDEQDIAQISAVLAVSGVRVDGQGQASVDYVTLLPDQKRAVLERSIELLFYKANKQNQEVVRRQKTIDLLFYQDHTQNQEVVRRQKTKDRASLEVAFLRSREVVATLNNAVALVQYHESEFGYPHLARAIYLLKKLAHGSCGERELALQSDEMALGYPPRTCDDFFFLGMFERSNGNRSKAIAHFQDALSINQSHLGTNFLLARTFLDNGDYELAFTYYQRSIALRPRIGSFYTNVGHALSVLYKQELGKNREAAKSEGRSFDPNLLKYRLEQMERIYRDGIKVDPDNPLLLEGLYNTLVKQRKRSEAIEIANELIRLEPENLKNYVGLAVQRAKTGQYTEALKALESSMAFNSPNDLTIPNFYNRACVYSLCAAAMSSDPSCSEQRSDLTRKALDDLRRAVDSGFKEPERLRSDDDFIGLRNEPDFIELGALLEKQQSVSLGFTQGNLDRVVKDASAALQINPKAIDLYHFRALAFCYKGEDEAAINDAQQALVTDRRTERGLYNVACVYSLIGERYKKMGKEAEGVDLQLRAIQLLHEMIESGRYGQLSNVQIDKDLEPVRRLPEFEKVRKVISTKLQ